MFSYAKKHKQQNTYYKELQHINHLLDFYTNRSLQSYITSKLILSQCKTSSVSIFILNEICKSFYYHKAQKKKTMSAFRHRLLHKTWFIKFLIHFLMWKSLQSLLMVLMNFCGRLRLLLHNNLRPQLQVYLGHVHHVLLLERQGLLPHHI